MKAKSKSGATLPATNCYPSCWIFDINRRTYARDAEGKSIGGGPIWREHWRPTEIVGETSRSWVSSLGKKIPKTGGCGICFSERELDEACWINENRYKLGDKIRACNDYAKLTLIAEILLDNKELSHP